MGIKPSHPNQLMVESDGCAFAEGLLGRNNKTFKSLVEDLTEEFAQGPGFDKFLKFAPGLPGYGNTWN